MDLSFQLYSARDAGSWDDFIPILARLGYTQVEGFPDIYGNAEGFRAVLDANNLSMPSGHFFPLASFETDLNTIVETAKTLGITRLFCPAPEEAYLSGADKDAWINMAARLEESAKRVRDADLRFGWHNHDWEFKPLADGSLPMRLILENAPSIEWEMDAAWIVRAGCNPLDWIADHGPRITAAHVKDIAPTNECVAEDGWADVGHGTMDWFVLMAALRTAGCDLFVCEHDQPSDAYRFAERSIASVTTY